MEETLFLLAAATIAAMWARAMVPRRGSRRVALDEGLEIALHVAGHEAAARKQRLAPAHLLYGLLQDEELRARAPRAGADIDAIENRLFARLEAADDIEPSTTPELSPAAARILDRTVGLGQSAGRPLTCADLFAQLARLDPGTVELCRATGADALDLLFVLVHGVARSELPAPTAGDVTVVLCNDDISSMELVVETLEQDFGLAAPEAAELMRKAHREGRAPIGRFSAAEARRKAGAATERARSRGFPLMIRLED